MAGISGFGLGGFASAFQQGMRDNSMADYRTQELKIQEQGQKNAMLRDQFARIDSLQGDLWKGIKETVEAGLIAGNKPADIAQHLQPLVERSDEMYKKVGLPPMGATRLATLLAQPPATQVIAAEARAKDVFGKEAAQAEVLRSEAEVSRSLTGTGGSPTPSGQGTPPPPSATPQPSISNLDPKTGQEVKIPGAGMALDPSDAGDRFLATQPEQLRQVIKDIAEYRRNPTSLAGRTIKGTGASFRDLVMEKVEQYAAAKGEPYDQTQYGARSRTALAFAGGVEARTTRSFNVLVSHLDVLKETADALKNGDITAFNRLKNVIRSELGQPEPDSFDAVKTIVADELAKAVIGSGSGALGDRQEIAARVNNAKSPAILATVMNDYQKLAAGQLEGLKQQYVSSGFKPEDFDKKFLLPRTQQFFRALQGRSSPAVGGGPAESGWQPTAIPGVRIRQKPGGSIPTVGPGDT